MPDTFFLSSKWISELWTVLKISFPGELKNCKRWQMGESSVHDFLIPKYPKKQGLCHEAQCSYSTLRKRHFRSVVLSCLLHVASKKELLRGRSGGWELKVLLHYSFLLQCSTHVFTHWNSTGYLAICWDPQVGFAGHWALQTSRHLIKTYPGMSTPAVLTPSDRGIPVKQYLNIFNSTKASDTSVQARCR